MPGPGTLFPAPGPALDSGGPNPVPILSEVDPGPVGSGRLWIVASTGAISLRNAANTAWIAIGGGSPWTKVIDESGASFANWTAVSGVWASAGGLIQQTSNVGGQERRAMLTGVKAAIGGPFIYECEFRLPTAGQVAADNVVALIPGGLAAIVNHPVIAITSKQADRATSVLKISYTGIGDYLISGVLTALLDTLYKLRVYAAGVRYTGEFAGSIKGSALAGGAVTGDMTYLGLYTFNAIADFRNIRAWTPVVP